MTSKENYIKGSDGLNYRVVQPYAKRKYAYLTKYIYMLTNGMKNRRHIFKDLTYIDLYASSGKCIIEDSRKEIDGSVLIALQSDFTKYIFNDFKKEKIEELKTRIKNEYGSKYEQCHFYSLDADKFIIKIINDGIVGKYKELSLVFSDPNGLSPSYNTIKLISDNLIADILIHFSYGLSLKRNWKSNFLEQSDILDNFIGDKDWRDIEDTNPVKVSEYYKSKLEHLGYRANEVPMFEIKNSKNALLYYLFLISKDPLGAKFGREAAKYASGQIDIFN